MKQNYKNILLQGWMFDCLDFMDNEEEQDKYLLALIRSALAGKVLTDNEKWVRFIEKALSSIEETRTKYYEKSKKNGMKGKEYGIEGEKYGPLGGRPKKGESPEDYIIRKKGGEDSQWAMMFNEIKENKGLIAQIKKQTISGEVINNFVERYGKETTLDVFEWILKKYNI